MKIWLIILGVLIMFGSIGSIAIGLETQKYSGLCVDGHGDRNLEGIMCEKQTQSWFGVEGDVLPLIGIAHLFLFLAGFIIFLISLNEIMEEKK